MPPVVSTPAHESDTLEYLGHQEDDDELSVLTQRMTTHTTTIGEVASMELVGENPMSPPATVADKIAGIQGEGRFLGMGTMLKDAEYPGSKHILRNLTDRRKKGKQPARDSDPDSSDSEGARDRRSGQKKHYYQKSLMGVVPKFDGDKTKSSLFESEFGLWRIINNSNQTMQTPMTRVGLALSCMKGEQVSQWAGNYANHLADQCWSLNGQAPKKESTDETIWGDFCVAFRRQYRDSAEMEKALLQLRTLEMKDKEVDTYISTFEVLLEKAKRGRFEEGSIDLFKDGLPGWLLLAIMKRPFMPCDLNQWQQFARDEVAVSLDIQAALGKNPKLWMSARTNQHQYLVKQIDGVRSKPRARDPDAMDVDAIKTRASDKPRTPKVWTPEETKERERLRTERRCFNCKRTGHMSRDCRDKGKQRVRTVQPEPNKPETSKEKGNDPPPSYEEKDLITAIKALSTSKREELMDKISLEEGF